MGKTKKVAPFWACVLSYASEHGLDTRKAQTVIDEIWPTMSREERLPFVNLAKQLTEERRRETPPLPRANNDASWNEFREKMEPFEKDEIQHELSAIIPDPPEQ